MTSKNSTVSAGLLFGTSAFGMGMLCLPASYNQLGYVGASLAMLTFGVLSWFSLYCLNIADESCKNENGEGTKKDYSYFGNAISSKLSVLISIAFVCSNMVVVCLFLTRTTNLTVAFIGKLVSIDKNENLIRIVVATLYSIAAYLFYIQKDLSMLKPLSYVGLAAALYYAVLMIILGMKSPIKFNELQPFNFDKGIEGLLNIVFAAHCQFAFLDFKATLSSKNGKSGLLMLTIGIIVIYASYTTCGFFGYKYLGSYIGTEYLLGLIIDNEKVKILTANNGIFPEKIFNGMLNLLVLLFAIIFFTNTPLTVITFLPEIEKVLIAMNVKPNKKYITLSVAVTIYGYTLLKLKSELVQALSAALFTNFLSFGFPGVYAAYYSKNKAVKIMGYSMLLFSTALAIAHIGYIIYEQVNKKNPIV